MKKSFIPILIAISFVLFGQDTLSQTELHKYCVAITSSNTVVKGLCKSHESSGEFIKKITIKDSTNTKIKLEANSIRMLLSSQEPISSIDQLNDKRGLVFEPLSIDNKNMGLAQLSNWKTGTKLKAYYGPVISKNAVPKGFLGMENGFEYEEQTFWIAKQDSNPVLVSKKKFEEDLNVLFMDCPTYHTIFKKANVKYKELLIYVDDYNRLCSE